MSHKAALMGILLISLVACNSSNSSRPDNSNEKKIIRNLFAEWQAAEIKAGRFWAADSCNPSWLDAHDVPENLDSTRGLKYGFPSDSIEYSISFGDLNNDGKLDGLILFNPTQCDGGNASMWIQWKVFILSLNESYVITDTIDFKYFTETDFDSLGFYWLDSVSADTVFGTYIEFKDDDGRCCPSIRERVMFDFSKRKLISVGR